MTKICNDSHFRDYLFNSSLKTTSCFYFTSLSLIQWQLLSTVKKESKKKLTDRMLTFLILIF